MEYRLFRIGDLFDIHPTNAYKMSNADLFATIGTTPVLSNSSINNGISGYSGLSPTEKGGIITFSDTTTGGDTMFYQADDFIGYPHVQGMYPFDKTKWTEEGCLYAIAAIRKAAGDGWSYAVKFNRALVKELKIELPVVQHSDPNHIYTVEDIAWKAMADRIKELETERVKELEAYLTAAGLNDYELTEEDKEVLASALAGGVESRSSNCCESSAGCRRKFKEFRVGDLGFKVIHGKRQTKADRKFGNIPLLTAGRENQGVAEYISNPLITCNDAITVDMFGNCFFHEGRYAGDDNIYFFVNDDLSSEAKLFIASAINKRTGNRYSYHQQFRQTNADVLTISIPITPSGTPDFSYVERYIKALEKLVIADVVKYKDPVIETTKAVVKED